MKWRMWKCFVCWYFSNIFCSVPIHAYICRDRVWAIKSCIASIPRILNSLFSCISKFHCMNFMLNCFHSHFHISWNNENKRKFSKKNVKIQIADCCFVLLENAFSCIICRSEAEKSNRHFHFMHKRFSHHHASTDGIATPCLLGIMVDFTHVKPQPQQPAVRITHPTPPTNEQHILILVNVIVNAKISINCIVF